MDMIFIQITLLNLHHKLHNISMHLVKKIFY